MYDEFVLLKRSMLIRLENMNYHATGNLLLVQTVAMYIKTS